MESITEIYGIDMSTLKKVAKELCRTYWMGMCHESYPPRYTNHSYEDAYVKNCWRSYKSQAKKLMKTILH